MSRESEKNSSASRARNLPPRAPRSGDQSAEADPVALRQQAAKNLLLARAALPPSAAALAFISLAIIPDGSIRTTALGIEPEHIDPLIEAMNALAARLRDHQEQLAQRKADRQGSVLSLRRPRD